jgi:hypothetical protein
LEAEVAYFWAEAEAFLFDGEPAGKDTFLFWEEDRALFYFKTDFTWWLASVFSFETVGASLVGATVV